MYIIDIGIKNDKIREEESEALLQAHRAWFKKHFEVGDFLLVGPYKDKAWSGLVLAQAENRSGLEAIIAQDAYYPDLASYDVHEFQANLLSERLLDYKEG